MEIAIVDDRPEDRRELAKAVDRYFALRDMPAACREYASGETFLREFRPGGFQIVFLDIYMEGLDGMETARRVYELDPACRMVFFTTSHAHAIESYDVRAAYYLKKPLESEKLCTALDICLSGMELDDRALHVPVENVETRVRFRDIFYVDCGERAVRFHTAAGVLKVFSSFRIISKQLDDPRFYACNRGVVVNLEWVEALGAGAFLLKNGEKVPIRQRGKGDAKRAYLRFTLRELCDGEDGL